MQRVNGHLFYDLAVKVHPLIEIKETATIAECFILLWEVRDAIINVFNQIPLRVCVPAAQRILFAVDSILPRDWTEAVKSGAASEETLGYRRFSLRDVYSGPQNSDQAIS